MALCGGKSVTVDENATLPAGFQLPPVYAKHIPSDAASNHDRQEIQNFDGQIAPQLTSLRVVLRVRPLISREKDASAKSIVVQLLGPTTVKLLEDPSGGLAVSEREFPFDRVLGPSALAVAGFVPGLNDQVEAYNYVAAPILERVMQGYNGTVFAYGQTGSGKTYTMEGAESTAKDARPPSAGSATPSDPSIDAGAGIIPRLCSDLFRGLQTMGAVVPQANGIVTPRKGAADSVGKPPLSAKASAAVAPAPSAPPTPGADGVTVTYTLSASYVEIYNEKVIDLLVSGTGSSAASADDEEEGPRIRQTPNGNIQLEGAVNRTCTGPADVAKLLKEGQGRRTRGETNMNAMSSRSHAVLTLYISITRTEASIIPESNGSATPSSGAGSGDTVSLTRTCKLSLIDLAGSERADATGAAGARLKEGAQINLSLTCLGRVIGALTTMAEGAVTTAAAHAAIIVASASSSATSPVNTALPRNAVHVPYRDSKLTRLLQDSLGGSAYTCMLACISPAAVNYDETVATLRFAARAKKVTNAARLNVDPREAKVAALTGEVKLLRVRLAAYEEALARRAVPTPIALSLPALKDEAELRALVGGRDLAAAVLEMAKGGKSAANPKSSCSIM